MDRYRLPKSITIKDKEIPFKSDFRDILYIFKIMNDPDLLQTEKIILSLENFYENDDYELDIEFAITEMMCFISGGNDVGDSGTSKSNDKPLYDWEQDYNIIVSPINRIIGADVRGMDYLHWWTFLSAFMEIGECTFSTFVGIRDKLNKHKKLEKFEERIYKENKDRIILKKRVDSTTQSLMDEIMGRGM